MARSLPPLNALRAFEAAGRHESFSRAAEELGVSHSAISRHVRGLEHRLNAQLFRDLPRGVALTPAGAQYLARITPAFDVIAEATERFAETPAGRVTVSVEPVFALKWLMPRIGAFQSAHPDIELRLEATDSLADMDRYEADLAIRSLRYGRPDVPADLISDAPLYPFAAPDLLAAPLTDPRALLTYPLLKERGSDTWGAWFALAGGVTPEEVPRPEWRMTALLAIEAAVQGQGIILASAEIMETDLAAGRLVRCFDLGLREGGYFLLASEGAGRRKTVRMVRDWLLTESAPFRSAEKDQPFG